MAEVELSIVVLQWNRQDMTERCVRSIRDRTALPYELIVVDNGSDQDAAEWVEAAADTAVHLDSNRGFAAGMNAGLERASGSLVAFVNNDTVLPERWDGLLVESLTEGIGIVVPVVSAGGNASTVRIGAGKGGENARPFIDLPSGVVYLMKTDLIRSLGGWPEHYPIASSEDLDLLFAVWCIGLDVHIDERVFVQHESGATAGTQLSNRGRIWRANRRLFADTWSSMDEPSFRARYRWGGFVSPDRLDQARIAAHWMRRYFDADDAASRASSTQQQAPDSKGSGHWWSRG